MEHNSKNPVFVKDVDRNDVASCSDKTKDAPRRRGVIREWKKHLRQSCLYQPQLSYHGKPVVVNEFQR